MADKSENLPETRHAVERVLRRIARHEITTHAYNLAIIALVAFGTGLASCS